MRTAAKLTLLGMGLLAATGCSSGAGGGYASTRSGWHWPWSKAQATPETAVAQGAASPTLPSQLAQGAQPGYPQNAYSAPPPDAYTQNPAGTGYTAPTSYSAQAGASTGLYDSQAQPQPAAMAQGSGYPQQAPAAGYADPNAGVNGDYYNQAYARPDANVAAAAPAAGYAAPQGYAPADPSQVPMGYDAQAAAAIPANPSMPQISHPEAQVADSRYGAQPAVAGAPVAQQSAYDQGYAQPVGDRYAPPVGGVPGAYQDPSAATATAGQYNEPSGFQPGATGYTPGATGFQPPGTAPYQAPAGNYTPSPTGSRYRPGSTGDYYAPPPASTSPAVPTRTSSTGSAVAPANYMATPNAPAAEVPAVYTPSSTDPAAGLPQ